MIKGLVLHDLNFNGSQGTSEPGIAGVPVAIISSSGSQAAVAGSEGAPSVVAPAGAAMIAIYEGSVGFWSCGAGPGQVTIAAGEAAFHLDCFIAPT